MRTVVAAVVVVTDLRVNSVERFALSCFIALCNPKLAAAAVLGVAVSAFAVIKSKLQTASNKYAHNLVDQRMIVHTIRILIIYSNCDRRHLFSFSIIHCLNT